MLRRVLLTAALIIGIAAAPAAAQYGPPGLVISPGTVRPGDSVSFTGTGCLPDQEVVISIQHRSGSAPVEVTRVVADAEGQFEGSFVVPDVPYGAYDVISSCGEVLSSAALQIVAPDQTPPSTPPGGGSTPPPGAGGTGASQGGGRSGPLPATGSDFNVLGLVGLGLLAVGGLVLLTTRTRSSRTA